MSLQASPRWNKALLALHEAEEMLKKATFIIRLGKKVDPYSRTPYYEWGTGFFFWSNDGRILALTADHNPRSCPRKKYFKAYYKGSRIKLEWVKEWSSQKADIAVMRLHENPDGVEIETLPVAYLDPSILLPVRKQFWGGKRVFIYGYAVRGELGALGPKERLEGWPVDGTIDTGAPLIDSPEEGKIVQRFNIHGSRIQDLGGISGAAILDLETRLVIGVEGSYEPKDRPADQAYVRGTEIAQLIDEHPELKSYFQPLFPPLEKPEKGIAVLARRQDEPLPSIVPISVRFCASETPTGVVTFDDEALQTQAQAAVQWVGEYLRRLRGSLRRVFEENHWGSHKPYGCALFHLPQGKYESLPAIHAGMVLAYMSKVFHDTLTYDLDLPLHFPESLLLSAAGFTSECSEVTGERGLADALRQFQPSGQATVLYARSQQEGLRQLFDLPKGVRLIPVDAPEDMVHSFLAEFIQEAKSSAVESHLKQMFKDDLTALLEQEKALKDAQAACLSREARLSELDKEIEIRQEELNFLNSKIQEIQQRLMNYQQTPPPSQLLEEYTLWLEQKRDELSARGEAEKAERIEVIVAAPEVVEEAEICMRLYRRLANLCHPDREPAEATWFPHLVDHRRDRLWLEAMEGALQPFGSEPIQPQLEEAASELFDRLFFLQSTRTKLKEKINDLKAEVDSYGDAWRAHLDEEINLRETMLRMRKYDIDQAWRRLNWLVGQEPFGAPGSLGGQT